MNDEFIDSDQIFMEGLKKEFEETLSKNLVDLKQLYKESKSCLGEIAGISHDIKGTAGIFGLNEGTEIAGELNTIAKNLEIEKIRELIEKLEAYMKAHSIVP